MATKLTASAVATFNNGASYSDDSPVVGYRSAGTPRVIRYTFTTPSSGASSYSVMISGCSRLDGDCTQLKCYLTTSSSSHSVATSAYSSDAVLTRRSTTTGYGQYEFYSGNITKSLAGSTTYYLWVFAASETKPLSMFLPKTGNQYTTDLATITVNEGSGGSTSTGTTVSTSDVTFTKLAYTDNNHPYTLIARVKETSSTSTTVTFSLRVSITSYTSGAGYAYTYGNKLDIKVNNSSLYYSDNMTNGSYVLDINYGSEVSLWSGTFTLNRGTNGKASGVVYVNFCQTQLTNFNPIIQENIISTQASGSVTKAPTAKSLTYSGSAQALVNAGTGTGTMYYSTTSASSGFSTSIPTGTNAGTYKVWYYSAATTYYSQSAVSPTPVTVTIGKASGYVTLSASSGSTAYGTSKTVTISSNHGGTLSVSSNNTAVSSPSRSGTTVTMTASQAGSATITVSCAATTNYNAASATYALTVNKVGGWVTLSSNSYSGTVGKNYTFTVSSHHGGSLSVSSSNTSVATASISGSTITVSPKASGSSTITVTSAATTNYNSASAGHSLTVVIYGIVYIDNGSGFEAYQVFIDNGTSWEQYIPYIDNGSSWEQYG